MNLAIEYIKELLEKPADAAKLKEIWASAVNNVSGTNKKDSIHFETDWGSHRAFFISKKRDNPLPLDDCHAKSLGHDPSDCQVIYISSLGETIGGVKECKLLIRGEPLTTAMQLFAVLYAQESWNSPDEWCEKFLQLHNSATGWKNAAVFMAFAIFMRHKGWTAAEQASYARNVLGWRIRKYFLCPLSQVIHPKELGMDAVAIGKQSHILLYDYFKFLGIVIEDEMQIDMSRYLDLPTTRRPSKLNAPPIFKMGWVLFSTEKVKLLSLDGQHQYFIPVQCVDILVAQFGPFCSCPDCKSLVKKFVVEGTCIKCAEKKFPTVAIQDYATDPLRSLKIHTDKIKDKAQFARLVRPVLMGCELEYMCKAEFSIQTRLALLKELKDFVIFKSDSSIPGHGFEIVTAPATFAVHRQRFTAALSPFPPALRSNKRTGMHIHLTRDVLTPLTIGRQVDFLNNPENKEFVELVGERELTSYCEAHQEYGWATALNHLGMNRQTVLNLHKTPTIEFRFFRAPLSLQSFLKNLEFVQMLLEFFTAGVLNLTPKQTRHHSTFIQFIKERNRSKNEERNACPNLFAHLKEKGAI